MVVGDAAPNSISVGITGTFDFGQLDQQVGCIGVDHAAAETSSGRSDSLSIAMAFSACLRDAAGFVRAAARRCRCRIDLGQLHVDGQVDQHRAGRPERIK